MFNNALSMIAVEVVCVFSFCGWFEHLNIYYCTSRDVSLKVHVHIVVNIQLWKTSCTTRSTFPYVELSKDALI